MKLKWILIIIIILAVIVLFWINRDNFKKVNSDIQNHDQYNNLVKDNTEKKITAKESIAALEVEKLNDIKVYINDKVIGEDEFEIQEKYLKDTSGKEFIEPGKVILEAIKHEIVLSEAKLNNINPEKDEDAKKKIAESMYEYSDKTLSKEKYVEKWVNIQIQNDIKSIYMTDIMEKIVKNDIFIDNEEAIKRKSMYEINSTSDNLRAAYEAYIEAKIDEYKIKVLFNDDVKFANY